jgi:hypothetical protein
MPTRTKQQTPTREKQHNASKTKAKRGFSFQKEPWYAAAAARFSAAKPNLTKGASPR